MGTLKSSQVPFAAFCYPRKGKGLGSHREKVGSGERGEVSVPAPVLGRPLLWTEWSRSRRETAGEGPQSHSACPVQPRAIIKVFILRYRYYYMPVHTHANQFTSEFHVIYTFSFLDAPYSGWDLSSPTRDRTCTRCVGSMES